MDLDSLISLLRFFTPFGQRINPEGKTMKKIVVISLLICCILSSCSGSNEKPDTAPVEFDPAYLNQQIRLSAVREMSEFKTDEPVGLALDSYSQNETIFPSNFNLKIFVKQNDTWVEIKEKPVIRSEDKIILYPEPDGQIVDVFPDLVDLTKEYHMRVYVFGDMTTLEGTKQVAAFVDFVLTP
jgi:hypothetical protein